MGEHPITEQIDAAGNRVHMGMGHRGLAYISADLVVQWRQPGHHFAQRLADRTDAETQLPLLLEKPLDRVFPHADKSLVEIMDGQTCLWDDAARAFDNRPHIEILDLLHVTSKLWELVHIFHPAGSARELPVVKLLTAARQLLERLCGYFDNHKSRMHYDRYLAAGYLIASGVIEGACRHVIEDRLERAGMHWSIDGARAMHNLRFVVINGQWDEFIRFRIQREIERLYPHAEQPPKFDIRFYKCLI